MNHIATLYYENCQFDWKWFPKLSDTHFSLNVYPVMNVRLAVQIPSSSVGNILKEFGPPEASGIVEFCILMDKFFDCLNVQNKEEYKIKRKPNLKPYSDVNDVRFSWLKNEFLRYFQEWKNSIEIRPGDFTKNAQSNMFLSNKFQPQNRRNFIKNSESGMKLAGSYIKKNGIHNVLKNIMKVFRKRVTANTQIQ